MNPADPRTPHAIRMQSMERGRQARSLRKIGPPFTPVQRRHLEDSLSVAVNAAMGLDAAEGRLGYIARYLAALDDARVPADAPRREGKLSTTQAEELKAVLEAVNKAVNASNCKIGSPLRNVAEHLLQQHRLWKAPKAQPLTAKERAAAARRMMMKSSAPTAQVQTFVEPVRPSDQAIKAHEAAIAAAEAVDPFILAAKAAAKKAFEKYDADQSGSIDKEELFAVLWEMGHANKGATQEARQEYAKREFAKADKDGSGIVDIDEFERFYVMLCQYDEAEKVARGAFAKYDISDDNCLQKDELFVVLIEAGVAMGDTAIQKAEHLAKEFALADTNDDNQVGAASPTGLTHWPHRRACACRRASAARAHLRHAKGRSHLTRLAAMPGPCQPHMPMHMSSPHPLCAPVTGRL